MAIMDQSQQPKQTDESKLHPMVVLRPGERVISEVKRHPYGILSMYFAGAVAIGVAGLLAAFAPSFIDESTFGTDVTAVAMLGVGIITVGIICMLLIATSIYWQNRWIITDDSITQITQDGLFGRRVSQLNMESLEDVTVDQHGIIQSMFNFGTLKAETAGEHSKFTFPFCPNPNMYARKILEVHEAFLHQHRHQPQEVNPVTPMNSPYEEWPRRQHQEPMQQQPPQHYAQPQYQQQAPVPQHQVQPPQSQQPYQQPQTPSLPNNVEEQSKPHKTPAIWGD